MMTAEDLICSWVDTSVDMVEKVAQKGISDRRRLARLLALLLLVRHYAEVLGSGSP